jgi:hypothetical protein
LQINARIIKCDKKRKFFIKFTYANEAKEEIFNKATSINFDDKQNFIFCNFENDKAIKRFIEELENSYKNMEINSTNSKGLQKKDRKNIENFLKENEVSFKETKRKTLSED